MILIRKYFLKESYNFRVIFVKIASSSRRSRSFSLWRVWFWYKWNKKDHGIWRISYKWYNNSTLLGSSLFDEQRITKKINCIYLGFRKDSCRRHTWDVNQNSETREKFWRPSENEKLFPPCQWFAQINYFYHLIKAKKFFNKTSIQLYSMSIIYMAHSTKRQSEAAFKWLVKILRILVNLIFTLYCRNFNSNQAKSKNIEICKIELCTKKFCERTRFSENILNKQPRMSVQSLIIIYFFHF